MWAGLSVHRYVRAHGMPVLAVIFGFKGEHARSNLGANISSWYSVHDLAFGLKLSR